VVRPLREVSLFPHPVRWPRFISWIPSRVLLPDFRPFRLRDDSLLPPGSIPFRLQILILRKVDDLALIAKGTPRWESDARREVGQLGEEVAKQPWQPVGPYHYPSQFERPDLATGTRGLNLAAGELFVRHHPGGPEREIRPRATHLFGGVQPQHATFGDPSSGHP
jgi:hypothetical protein